MNPRTAAFAARFAAAARQPQVTRRVAAAAALGVASVAAYQLADADRLALARATVSGYTSEFYLRWVAHADEAKSPAVLTAPKGLWTDTSTDIAHPLELTPAASPALALVGVGVRTVSFLRVKVYSAGFYVDSYTLGRLGSLPGWSAFTAESLGGPEAKNLVASLLNAPAACAVRIVPVRNTDFGHLRDGLTRTLLARQKAARIAGELTPDDDERLTKSVQQLKAIFPTGTVHKGKQLLLVRSADGHLFVEFEGRVLGGVHDKWLADNMMMAYFDQDAISPVLRDTVGIALNERLHGKTAA